MNFGIRYPKYAHNYDMPDEDQTGTDVVIADETDIAEKVAELSTHLRKGDFLEVTRY